MLETTAENCSVALSNNGILIDQLISEDSYKHSEILLPYIDQILTKNGINKNQLAAISINSGPGSYTGLRIGISTAKAICEGLDIPLIANNCLAILTHSYLTACDIEDALICPMVDARRMEVYQCIYNSRMELLAPIEPKIIEDLSYLISMKGNNIIFVGDGALKYKDMAPEKQNINIAHHVQEAKHQSNISFKNFKEKKFEDLVNFEPFYVKNFKVGIKKK